MWKFPGAADCGRFITKCVFLFPWKNTPPVGWNYGGLKLSVPSARELSTKSWFRSLRRKKIWCPNLPVAYLDLQGPKNSSADHWDSDGIVGTLRGIFGHFLKAASVNIRCSSRLPFWSSMRAAMRRILSFRTQPTNGSITSSLQTCASLRHLLPSVLIVSWSSVIFKPAFTDFSRTSWSCNRCKSDPKSCSWFSCVRVHQ